MTDNTRMVDLPWHDGTTRTVPEWTPYKAVNGYVFFARDGGYSYRGIADSPFRSHDSYSAAVRIFTEAPEPPVKVPTGIGAVVSFALHPDVPGYVLTREGWLGLNSWTHYEPTQIAGLLRRGARVLYEGVDE